MTAAGPGGAEPVAKAVLCLAEADAAGLTDASLRALSFARQLAAGEELVAAWFGASDAADQAQLAAAGASRAYAIGSDELDGYAPLAWARALAGLATAIPAAAVVAASTDRGNEVLAHLAALTGQPMAANCVRAAWTAPAQCRLLRQRWAGSLLEDAELAGSPALLTVATDAVAAAPPPAGGSAAQVPVQAHLPQLADTDLTVKATESAERSGGMSLATARVVVGGGRGVGGPEGFAVLEELAGLLGGAVGVSRVVTSQGWRPHMQQVGQTGTKITPELYVACGISGAIQHMAGCQGAKTIIAINTDAGAPILSRADYAVIGDLHEILPGLIAALRARRPA